MPERLSLSELATQLRMAGADLELLSSTLRSHQLAAPAATARARAQQLREVAQQLEARDGAGGSEPTSGGS